MLSTRDITRAKAKIDAKLEPWLSSWSKLTSIPYSSTSFSSNAVSTVGRNDNGEVPWHDVAAAFDLALCWRSSGNDTYAATAADILVSWADTLEALSGSNDDGYLTAGLQGYMSLPMLSNRYETILPLPSENGLSAVTSMTTSRLEPVTALSTMQSQIWYKKEPGTGNPLGQGQESSRDRCHSVMDYQLLGAVGQQAWYQGKDLFGYNDNRILLG
ncbi:hypothetical protein F4809DRAFT_643793 [Biscogniauxia mediterranea]|nr:hypothetical protein F4809DRAFT_643793 [Biscogniauxia mediterranea]